MAKQEVNWNLILNVGLVIAAYKIVGEPILQALNIIDTAEEKQRKEELTKLVQNQADVIAKTQTPSKSDAEWQMIANTIYEDLKYSSIADNKDDAAYQLARARNDADVFKLIQFFGSRQGYWFGLPLGELKNMQTFIATELSTEKIAAVNDNYLRKGIKFRW